MYQALYRKYRPQSFDDVVGQMSVTQTLKTQVKSGKLSHAYLFTGSRGTGKTSSAKILAKAVNCERPQDGNPCNCCDACRSIDSGSCMDVLEIDAASNNGVDNVRDLRDDAVYSPAQVKMRVYIIDEVHMLSLSAFNALLKIIEEPPDHLLFILATTELHKVPATILSRCQRFAFRRISQEDIAARLQYVAYQENIDMDDSAARILARLADGGMRDGLSLLDQCASATSGELNAEQVYACLGIAGIFQTGKLMDAIANRDTASALSIMNQLYAEGKDMAALLDELACLTRDFMVLKTAPEEGISLLSGVASDNEVKALCSQFSSGELTRMLSLLQETKANFSRSESRRMDAELCIVKMCQPELDMDIDGLLARLTRIEEQIATGDFAPRTVPQEVSQSETSAAKPPVQDLPVIPADSTDLNLQLEDQAPVGFWTDVARSLKSELSPSLCGFFGSGSNAPVQGLVNGDILILLCANNFILDIINKPEILASIARKASAKLGRPLRIVLKDRNGLEHRTVEIEDLLDFGRNHSDVINIKSTD